jgi:hypothetical protein
MGSVLPRRGHATGGVTRKGYYVGGPTQEFGL